MDKLFCSCSLGDTGDLSGFRDTGKEWSLISGVSGSPSEMILGSMVLLPHQIWQGLAPVYTFGEATLSTKSHTPTGHKFWCRKETVRVGFAIMNLDHLWCQTSLQAGADSSAEVHLLYEVWGSCDESGCCRQLSLPAFISLRSAWVSLPHVKEASLQHRGTVA